MTVYLHLYIYTICVHMHRSMCACGNNIFFSRQDDSAKGKSALKLIHQALDARRNVIYR